MALLLGLREQTSHALERASLRQAVSNLAARDGLTRMFNARSVDEILEREVRRCRRYTSNMALIFLDLDGFKEINALYSHPVGSQCLAEAAEIMRNTVREVDLLGRYGGDEFVVILPETSVAIASTVAERLREAIETHVFVCGRGLSARLTISGGIAGFPEHAQTGQELIRQADQAMYRAKGYGGNRILVANQPSVAVS